MKVFACLFLLLMASGTMVSQEIPLETGLMLRKRVVIAASPRQLFDQFSSVKGVQSFFAPYGKIELAINGAYELYFLPQDQAGSRGNEGGRILSFIPGEMISFSWNNPPTLKSIRNQYSWVVVFFTPLEGDRTQVDLIHLGFRAGAEWSEALKYFDQAWDLVLERLAHSVQYGPIDWNNPDPSKKKE